MINCVYFNENVRCYSDGMIERKYKNGWKICGNKLHKGSRYHTIYIGGKYLLLHRVIGYCFLGLNINDEKIQIDHMNRICIDNRVENLRIVTNNQNQLNRNSKGYYFDKRNNKWKSQIGLDGKQFWLGYYDTEQEARLAYLDAKERLHII